MFRKTMLALAAVVTLGTAALIPATADAHWSGYGWYGKSYGSPYYWGGYGPRYHYGYGGFYGPRSFYWGKFGWVLMRDGWRAVSAHGGSRSLIRIGTIRINLLGTRPGYLLFLQGVAVLSAYLQLCK